MTVVIDVTFPLGYVHATPWGTHVNEGTVEWPLSPWRLLRGLVATWKSRLPDIPDEVVVPLLTALAGPPALRVAPRTEASIRSYLPAEVHRRGIAGGTDLVIDAFAAVEPGTGVSYRWSADLDDDGRDVLGQIVERLPYLGRAESVCAASVRFRDEDEAWQEPADDATGLGSRVLVPDTPLDMDGLCTSIRSMRKGGRLLPVGARWVRYVVPPPIAPRLTRVRRAAPRTVPAARFALRGRAPISVRQTLVVAEVMRAAAMSKYGTMHAGETSEIFAGKDDAGTRLSGPHGHAHWLPLDLDGDRLLDTILVWAPCGLGEAELGALSEVRRLNFNPGDSVGSATSVAVGLEAVGEVSALKLGGVLGPASTWRSATPFLPQRHQHPKRESFEAFIHDCIVRDLVARDIHSAFSLEIDKRTSWGSYRRHRRGERRTQARSGYGFTINFDEPLAAPAGGPLCLGALSHFGLGRFEACPS